MDPNPFAADFQPAADLVENIVEVPQVKIRDDRGGALVSAL